jgi:hypothetical protein
MVADAIMTDPELTQRQRQMLIEIYESFRKETAAAAAGDAAGAAELAWPEDPAGTVNAAPGTPALPSASSE